MYRVTLAVMALVAFAAPTFAQTAQGESDANGLLTAEQFAAPAYMSSLRLSPAGTRLSYLQSDDDKAVIVIADPADPYTPLRRIEMEGYSIAEVQWANERRLLVQTKRNTFTFSLSFFGLVPVTRLAVVDVETGDVRQIDEDVEGYSSGEVLHVTPDGRYATVARQDDIDEYMSVYRVDLDTGVSERIQKPVKNVWDWYVDPAGVVRGGLEWDERKYTLHLRDSADGKLHKIKGKFDKDEVEQIDEVLISPISGQSTIISNHATGRFAVYRLDLETVEPGALLFENPEGDVDDLLVETETAKLLGVRYHDDRWRTHWFDEDFAALQARVDRAFPDNDNQVLDWTRGRGKVLIRSQRPDDPGVYYLFDRAAGQMHIVGTPYPSLPEGSLAPVRSVRYTARDGLEIPAFLTLPPGREDAKGLPLVMLPHGGPFARDEWIYDPHVQFLASRGYAVLQPQFRGSTGRGRAFVEAGFGQMGYKMQDDLDDGIDWLVEQGTVDPNRVCIYGISYGGYAALWGAIRDPERYRCAVSMAGLSDVRKMLKYSRSMFTAKRYYRNFKERVAGVDPDKESMRAISPYYFADRLRIPTMIAHGQRDDVVPASQSAEMIRAIKEAGIEVEEVFYKKSRHGPTDHDEMIDWLNRLEAFLAKHNPA